MSLQLVANSKNQSCKQVGNKGAKKMKSFKEKKLEEIEEEIMYWFDDNNQTEAENKAEMKQFKQLIIDQTLNEVEKRIEKLGKDKKVDWKLLGQIGNNNYDGGYLESIYDIRQIIKEIRK